MPILLLVRHGENEYVKQGRLAGRLAGVHLNEKGQAQAATLASRLAGFPVKAIYSSPLERALETAAPLAKTLSLEVIQLPGLIEMDIGEWQGEKLNTLRRNKLWKCVQNSPSRMIFPAGESFLQAQARIVNELHQLAHRHAAKDLVVCVSHSDPIKLVVAYFLGMPLDMFQRITISTASVTTLAIHQEACQILNVNHDLSFNLPLR
jgi:probable phosphoglycerate mutase